MRFKLIPTISYTRFISVKVVLPYLVNFGPFLTNLVHQIGEKTEKNSDKILLSYHFFYPSLFLNIKICSILSSSKKFYILPNGHKISISDTPVSIEINLQWNVSLCFKKRGISL